MKLQLRTISFQAAKPNPKMLLLLLHLFVQTYAVYSSTHTYIHTYIYTHNLEALDASCPKAIEVGLTDMAFCGSQWKCQETGESA
jgi:hypothetical protein